MTVARKILLILVGLVVILAATVYWIIGTEAGTRFLLARAPLPTELELEDVRGSLLHGIGVDSIQWTSSDINVAIRDIEIDIALRRLLARHVWVQSLTIGSLAVRTEPAESEDSSDRLPAFESPIDVTLELSTIRNLRVQVGETDHQLDELRLAGAVHDSRLDDVVLAVRSSWLDIDLVGKARLDEDMPADLDVQWRWSDEASLTVSGHLKLNGDREKYSVQHALDAPLALQTAGHATYVDGVVAIDLQNTWQSIEWPVADKTLASAVGELRLFGPLDDLAFALSTDIALDGGPAAQINARGAVDTDGAQFSDLNVSNSFGQIAVTGHTSWPPTPEFDVAVEIVRFDPSAARASLTGDISGFVTARGDVKEDGLAVDIGVASLAGNLNNYELGGSGAVSYDGKVLRLERSIVRVGDNSLRFSGTAGDSLSLSANADLPDIAALNPGADGSLSFALSVRGRRDDPVVRLNGSGTGLSWAGVSTESLEFDATGTAGNHTLLAAVTSAQGNAAFEARGGLQQGTWDGEIRRLAVAQQLAGDWRLRESARLTISAQRVLLSGLCLQRVAQEGEFCATLDAPDGDTTNFYVAVTKLPLAAMPVTLPEGVTVAGLSDASAVGSFSDNRLSAELNVKLQDARFDAVVDDEPVAAILEHAEGSAIITDNALLANVSVDLDDDLGTSSIALSAADVLDTGSAIEGQGNLAIDDLTLLGIFVPDIANPRGAIRGSLSIGGTLAEPTFTGDLAVSDAAFEVRRAGIEVRDIEIQLAQSAPGRLRFDGQASSGEGFLAVDGNTWVSSETGIRSEIRLRGNNFELIRLPDWRVAASPDIVAVFDDQVTRVSGELAVPSANILVRDIPQAAETASADVVVHRADRAKESPRRRIEVDVNAVLGDDVNIAAFGLSTGITGAVRLNGGSNESFEGFGRLSLRGGRYKAYGQDLDIERGELIFNGPLENPTLDVRAIRRATDVVAGIQLTGTPSQLRSNVFSEPPLSEAEALSYLLTGRPLSSASETGDGDMLNAAAFALGVSSAGSIVSEIRAGLGLETLAIEGGPDDGRLIAGKRFGDRLLVEYGYGLVDNLGTLLLRYRLSDRVTLESRTGTVSNFDIVYSVKKD
ncbi:MAG: translocation/assembly module TamB domain-containing protein [Woeseiaceae bacterium]|nr:translocation/assembly module TamB domain-containing protein [Woeseiaceae bacterium]